MFMLLITQIYNFSYAVINLILGLIYNGKWYFYTCIYHFIIASIRLYLYKCNQEDTKIFRLIGIMILLINISLLFMIPYQINHLYDFKHSTVVEIGLSAYTFLSLILALLQRYIYHYDDSKIITIKKDLSLIVSLVSLLSLTVTMLSSFSTERIEFIIMIIGICGLGVELSIFSIAINMIISNKKTLKIDS